MQEATLCVHRLITTLLITLLFLSTLTDSVIQTSCYCPRLTGIIMYKATCPSSNDMMVVKRTLVAMTPNRSVQNFCSSTVTLDTRHCVIEDKVSVWSVKSLCNARSGECLVSYTLADNYFITCPSQEGWVYACLEYDCTSRSTVSGVEGLTIYLSPAAQKSYQVTSRFHMMTSYYPSPASSTKNQCTMVLPSTANVILRIWDLRSRFIGAVSDERSCAYHLYIATGLDYKDWCAQTNWDYAELMVAPSGGSGNRTIDVVFNSQFPDQLTEGAVWITVEASTDRILVLCGEGIPLHNVPAPAGTRTVPLTTTTSPGTATTTRAIGPPGDVSTTTKTTTSQQPGPATTTTTTTTTATTRTTIPVSTSRATTTQQPTSGQQSSVTTRQQSGPQTATTTTATTTTTAATTQAMGPPGQSSTSSTTTIRQPGSTPPTTHVTTTRQSSQTTSRQPVGPVGPVGPTIGSPTGSSTGPLTTTVQGPPGQAGSTTRVPGQPSGLSPGSTTTLRLPLSVRSYTPGVPTPGIPTRPSALTAESSGSSNHIRTVAIAVTVVVVGLILLVALIMSLIWFFKWRHEDSGYRGGLTNSGYRATIE